jgi:thiamine-phosphate pyrophosphorylase
MPRIIPDYALYLVTDRNLTLGRDLVTCVEQAIAGGVTMVQLREKNLSTRDFYQQAQQLKLITDKYNLPLIINDRLDIALAVDAAGVHLGQADLPAAVARQILGPDKIIGVSTSTLAESLLAQSDGADYLGVGAMFPTATKTDADAVSFAELASICEHVRIPVVAIGGINAANANECWDAGVTGLAVVSAILAQPDITIAADNLRQH